MERPVQWPDLGPDVRKRIRDLAPQLAARVTDTDVSALVVAGVRTLYLLVSSDPSHARVQTTWVIECRAEVPDMQRAVRNAELICPGGNLKWCYIPTN